jgi:hypothetical protein
MIFSDEFKIKKTKLDDWFDPILTNDTKLFIDPFLIFDRSHKFFINSHEKVIDFFNSAFEEAAKSQPLVTDVRYRVLLKMMILPEVQEICLGYASRGTEGSGSGGGFAKVIVGAIYESIKMGLKHIDHFEELGIFNQGIGCDRISDITANILKQELIVYTQDICKRHNIRCKRLYLNRAKFNMRFKKWEMGSYLLPENPYRPGRAVLLVPKIFLRDLPTLSPSEFYNYCWDNMNEEIRDQFSVDIKNEVNKSKIIEIAREHREWVDEFKQYKVDNGSNSYNLVADPKGYYSWAKNTSKYVQNHPLTLLAHDSNSFKTFTNNVLDQFEQFIENNSGYKLLWDDGLTRSKSEEAAQLIFTGIVKHYCRANNIDLSRENNLGRGPVDFKFSNGYLNRALIEVKLAHNTKFWNGLKLQLPKYLEVEEIDIGYYLVICYTDSDFDRIKDIEKVAKSIEVQTKKKIDIKIIDATTGKLSASRLK